MNKAGFVSVPVYMLCMFFLSAQTGMPMPAPNVPYSFEYYDKNSNGVLDEVELSTYVLTGWSRKNDDYLAEDEWLSIINGGYPPSAAEAFRDFSYWDNDGDDRLYFDEVKDMLVETGIFSFWDEDADMGVSKNEVSRALYRIYRYEDDDLMDLTEWEIFIK